MSIFRSASFTVSREPNSTQEELAGWRQPTQLGRAFAELDIELIAISSRINSATKQSSNTRYMVFKVPRIIAEPSAGLTLEPGDVILTGTPPGVGFARKPPEWLKAGDVMEMEIEGIGVLRNRIVP